MLSQCSLFLYFFCVYVVVMQDSRSTQQGGLWVVTVFCFSSSPVLIPPPRPALFSLLWHFPPSVVLHLLCHFPKLTPPALTDRPYIQRLLLTAPPVLPPPSGLLSKEKKYSTIIGVSPKMMSLPPPPPPRLPHSSPLMFYKPSPLFFDESLNICRSSHLLLW